MKGQSGVSSSRFLALVGGSVKILISDKSPMVEKIVFFHGVLLASGMIANVEAVAIGRHTSSGDDTMTRPRRRTAGLQKERRPFRSADSERVRMTSKISLTSVASMVAVAFGLHASSVLAVEFSSGGVYGSIDTTISHGILYRIEDPDPALLAKQNSNDGNYNYPRGIVSNASKFTTDFSLETDTNDFAAFARITGFYDFENSKGERARTPLSGAAKSVVGHDIELLDLYGTWALNVADPPVDLRLGQFVLNWGESTYITNGINVINPVDVSKLRLSGSELRESQVPVGLASIAVYPTDSLSFEGFVQLDWEPIKIDPRGTYFSSADFAGVGGDELFVTLPNINVTEHGLSQQSRYGIETLVTEINADLPANLQQVFPDPDFLKMQRSADKEPGSKGQYGLAFRLFAESLNDTEFGAYFIRYHNRLPIVTMRTSPLASIQAGLDAERLVLASDSETRNAVKEKIEKRVDDLVDSGRLSPDDRDDTVEDQLDSTMSGIAKLLAIDRYSAGSQYFLEYPKDQSLFGLSFNTQLGSTGWALQGEMSFRPDVPLQRAFRATLTDGLDPILCRLDDRDDCADLATYQPDAVNGYVERSVSQLQATATKSFGPMMGSDGMTFLAELAVLHVHDMPDASETPIDSPASQNEAGYQDANANSFGYRLAAQMDYLGAIGAVNLFPYARFQHDFRGNSPSPIGPFIEGRKGLTLGVRADYGSQWEFDAGVSFMWGDSSTLRDRDFFYSSIKYSF